MAFTCVQPLNIRDKHSVCSSYTGQVISWSHQVLRICCCLLSLPPGELLPAQLCLVDLQEMPSRYCEGDLLNNVCWSGAEPACQSQHKLGLRALSSSSHQ